MAHLAGGIKYLALTPKLPDWRWGLEENSTFWYLCLFRQKEHGNWDEVMERVTNELHEYFGDKSTPAEHTLVPASKTKNRQTPDILAPISLESLLTRSLSFDQNTEPQGNALENVKKELMALERTLIIFRSSLTLNSSNDSRMSTKTFGR